MALAPYDQAGALDQHFLELTKAIHSCTCELQALKKQLLQQLPAFVDEWVYIVAPQTATSCATTPQVSGVIRCGTIIASATNACTLQLGDRFIPLPAGTNVLRDTGILLRRRDPRILTQTVAGAMSLEICGTEIPERGMW